MQIDEVLVNMESNLINYNNVKDIVLQRLITDEIITEDQGMEYAEKMEHNYHKKILV